ncbi:unnamed protein product [Calicophoron daubneyi]|uniref:Dipeptidyl aminopeptidase n=1 Tax=Calicophoron daubneyi TaxID=300641 RepID=A0AAV2T266_CALDB
MPSLREESLISATEDRSSEPKLLAKPNGADVNDEDFGNRSALSNGAPRQVDPEDPELLENNPQKRNWRGILLALFVIAFISAIIITASILTTPRDHPTDYGKQLTFSDMMTWNKYSESLNYELKNDDLIYLTQQRNLMRLNLNTMEERQLLSHLSIEEKSDFLGWFSMSSDLSAVILGYDGAQEGRHSRLAKYDALLLKSQGNTTVVEQRIELGLTKDPPEQAELSFVQWAPADYTMALVQKGHVYIHEYPFDSERSKITNITRDLPHNDILYGEPNWLYEEELLQTNIALWWNPTGSRLAFMSFNQRNVTTYPMYQFGDSNELYGKVVKMKYPKAGDPSEYTNPTANLFIYDRENSELRLFERPDQVPWDGYLTLVRWFDEDRVIAGWTNRLQTQAWITVVSWSRNSSWVIFSTSVSDGWVHLLKQTSKEPIFHRESNSIFIILPREYNDKAFRGIAKIKMDPTGKGNLQTIHWQVTPDFDISDILYYDGRDEFLFTTTGPDPKNMHLYWGTASKELACLTCDNKNCTHNRVSVTSDGKYFVQGCNGPDVPTVSIKGIRKTQSADGNRSSSSFHLRTMVNNTKLKEFVYSRAMPKIEYTTLKLRKGTRDELEVHAKLMLPPELNKMHVTKYPLLVYTYGGPLNQMVTTKFALDWLSYLSATVKVVVLSVDGRGTTNRGRLFENAIYKKLGTVEIDDQLDSVRTLLAENKFINRTKVGVYGWSYGGFTVGHLLEHPENEFIRCGVAVAPVTDFRYYDTAYTERYLGRITDEPDAYMKTQLGRNPKNLRTKSLLLVHGTGDDNVHFINSASLVKKFIKGRVDVDVMVYPDDNHSLRQSNNREHLYRKMITFFVDCFNQTSIRYKLDMSVKEDL